MLQAIFALAVPDSLFALDSWLLRTTLGGGVVLLIGSLWMLLTRQPAQRQRIGELALLAALIVSLPAAFPAWWSLPGTEPNSRTNKALFGKNVSANQPVRQEIVDSDLYIARDGMEEDDAELDLVTLLQTIQQGEEKDALKKDANLQHPEKNTETDVKGMIVPTSIGAFRWTLRLIGLAYLGLAIALLIRCSVGYYGLWRYWQQRRPAPAHVHAILNELEPDTTLRPRIGVNHLVHGPVSYGLWKQTILLPPHFCNEGDPDKLRWILAHELTHLRRRDAWGCLLLALGGALYFHVPWFWWMKRHVRLAQEYLADAAAVQTANAVEYAQYLVSLTTLTSRPTLASSQAAGVFETPSDLYRRVHMLLHSRSTLDRSAPRWWTLTAAASFLALAACSSGIQLYADEPEKKTVEVVVVTGDDAKGDKKQDKKTTVTINGKVVSSDDKNIVIVTDDDNNNNKDKPHVIRWQGQSFGVQQKQLDEVLKKLDQTLEKLPKQVDGDTRARLEELKKSLKALKDSGNASFFRMANPVDGQMVTRVRALGSDEKKAVELRKQGADVLIQEAKVAREHALAAQKMAMAAQEKALAHWQDAKDGHGRDAAIAELEKAIAEKERALKALKSSDDKNARARVIPPLGGEVATTRSKTTTAPAKGRLGVVAAEIDAELRKHLDLAEGQGVMLQEVVEPSAAWNQGNGLRSSDILIELGGKKVPANPEEFRNLVTKLNEGTIQAVIFRKGKKLTINGIKLPVVEKANKVVFQANPVSGEAKTLDIALAPLVKVTSQVKLDPTTIKLGDENLLKDLHVKLHADQHAKLHTDLHTKLHKDQTVHLKLQEANSPDKVVVGKLLADANVTIKPAEVALGNVHLAPQLATVNLTQQQGASKPRLGVMLDAVPEIVASQVDLADDRGLLVTDVVEGTPAQKAGFQKNDILIEFADKPVTRDHAAFSKMVREIKPGKYTATVVRKGKEIRLREIQLADVKAQEEERKAKAKAWTVDGEDGKNKEEKEEAKNQAKRQNKKDKEDFFPNANRGGFQRQNGSTTISINNDGFTLKNVNESKTITVTGKMVAGKAQPTNIVIKNDGDEKKYKTVKDVPAEDRPAVEKLLASFRGNNFQMNFNGMDFNQGQFGKQLEQQLKLLEQQLKQLDGEGFDNVEKQMEQMREQLLQLKKNRDDN